MSEIMVDLSVSECPNYCDECEYVTESGRTHCKYNKCKPGFIFKVADGTCNRQ